MVDGERERRLARAFVDLADTLVDDYDVVELMHQMVDHCVALLGASAAGLLLADQNGALRVMAASSERSDLLEIFQLQTHEGPCLDCYDSGAQVVVDDLSLHRRRWPRFTAYAIEEGYRSVAALPMRLRADTVGTLNLFHEQPSQGAPDDLAVAQALADVATISILQQRAMRHRDVLVEQLQVALDSRVVIEQAKGVLSERLQIGLDDAFVRLRRYARSANLHLAAAARSLVDGELDERAVLGQ